MLLPQHHTLSFLERFARLQVCADTLLSEQEGSQWQYYCGDLGKSSKTRPQRRWKICLDGPRVTEGCVFQHRKALEVAEKGHTWIKDPMIQGYSAFRGHFPAISFYYYSVFL